MNSAQKQLFWIKSPNVSSETLRLASADNRNADFVLCTESESVNPKRLAVLKRRFQKNGQSLIEMPGDPETIIPSLARVLKADEVILIHDSLMPGYSPKMEEIRHRLNMHSISFKEVFKRTELHTSLKSLLPTLDWISDPGFHRLPPAF